MCGRFALFSSPARIQKHFATLNELDYEPHFNIAPTLSVPVIRTNRTGKRICVFARWGLIPSCVSDSDEMQQPFNAKAEMAAIKPMFRNAYRKSRVLIPADAFYEWSNRNGKQPYLIKLKDGETMGIGGLLESWHGYESEVMTFTILTTHANLLLSSIHDRMPVIIKPEDYAAWLDTKLTDILKIQAMAQPYPERLMEAHPISRNINNPQHDSPELMIPMYDSDQSPDHSTPAGSGAIKMMKQKRTHTSNMILR
jgi:putative SOS response-associated peptidase YedK